MKVFVDPRTMGEGMNNTISREPLGLRVSFNEQEVFETSVLLGGFPLVSCLDHGACTKRSLALPFKLLLITIIGEQ